MEPHIDIFIGPAWIIARDPYGEVTWYLTEKELRALDTILTTRDAVRKREGRQ